MTKTYRIVGTDITRKSTKTYTHAVAYVESGKIIYAPCFCSSYELATKAMSQHRNGELKGWKITVASVECIE